jgi:hypothetical protein
VVDREGVNAEDCNEKEDDRDINPDSVPYRQPLVGHDESDSRDGNDNLEIPDLKESLSMLQEQGD